MRPLLLTLSAFGPYADEQALDFTRLEDRNFFLIHGPTGAGKSSILDALCFALYGETSGGEKETRHIRSDFSLAHEETRVCFDFRLGDRHFRVSRSPEQERPKKRGEGTTRQLAQATLWRIEGQEQTVLADRWGRVTEEIIRITGFDVHQFRQVVVLPQGQFRQFLIAGSADRQKILETLFQTGRYRDIEEALKEAAKTIRQEFEDVTRRMALLLESEEAEDQVALATQIHEMDNRINEQEALLASLRVEENTARQVLDRGREDRRLLIEAEHAAQAFALIMAGEAENARQKEQLRRAVNARGLGDAETRHDERQRERDEALHRLEKAQAEVESARTDRDRAQAVFEKHKATEPDIIRARAERAELDGIGDRMRAFLEAEKRYDQSQAHVDTLARTHQASQIVLERVAEDIRNHARNLETAKTLADQVDLLIARNGQLQKDKDRLTSLEGLRKTLAQAEKDRQAAQDSLRRSEDALAGEKEALEQMERRYHSGQAALLAARLMPGDPCPVCGSTDHPNKAAGDASLPDAKHIDDRRAQVKKRERDCKEKANAVAKANEHWVACVSRMDSLKEELGGLAGEPSGRVDGELAETGKRLREAQAQAAALPGMQDALDTLYRHETREKDAQAITVQSLEAAKRDAATCKAIMDERRESIPEPYRDAARLKHRIGELANQILRAEEALDTARQNREAALNLLAAKNQALDGARDIRTKAETQWKQAEASFDLRLREAGFADIGDYRSAVLSTEKIVALENAIRDYGEKRNASKDRLDRARNAAKDRVMPDIESLERQVADIASRLESLGGDRARHSALLGRKKKVVSDLNYLAVRADRLEKRYACTGGIADVANARGANASGMTFQRYVLAALFDDVLYSAGRHLKSMSRNRFDLEREQDRSDRRSAGGLDLRVVDEHTGTTRPVATLSGGESFLASLALALGLADVVQSYAGGIKLDTIFVDEGFGSLDPETLDLAFRAFADLQTRGRLVGIISHVPELKERIPTRLEVVPGHRGSRARFVM